MFELYDYNKYTRVLVEALNLLESRTGFIKVIIKLINKIYLYRLISFLNLINILNINIKNIVES